MSEKTVSQLKKEKEKELEELIQTIKKNETRAKATRHGSLEIHIGILKELDTMYPRRRFLSDLLKEI